MMREEVGEVVESYFWGLGGFVLLEEFFGVIVCLGGDFYLF